MTTEKKPRHVYTKKAPSRGGARNGGGRPPGSTNKLTGTAILAAIENQTGTPFAEQLAINYQQALNSGLDGHLLIKYDQLILNKVVADKTHIDIEHTNQDMIDDIIARLQGKNDDN